MIELIISGGQTGVDITAWKIARLFGIKTAGFMPREFRTLDGKKPEYKSLYGAVEHKECSYNARTADNVKWSDGTLRIAEYPDSAGEKCTKKWIDCYSKPYFDVNTYCDSEEIYQKIVETCLFIHRNNIKRLNVAGNSEKTSPGISDRASNFLYLLFEVMGFKHKNV